MAADPFNGGGEAGAILRGIDWSGKSIGPVESWPASLHTALSICLSSRHPICIIWGPDRLYFYNDAYAPILGAKHPWALGESYVAVWPEIWESAIRPMLEQVERTGEASWCDDLLLVLRRHGFDEECYFAFSFAPTRVEDGSVGGVFTAITETTAQVIGQRRLHTLRDLGLRAPEAKSEEEACRIAADVLAANPHDVPFALFYLVDASKRTARLVEQPGVPAGSPGAPANVDLDGQAEDADPWRFREVVRSGGPVVLPQLQGRLEGFRTGPWPEPPHTALVLPIARPGEALPYGFLVCGTSPRRPLDADYHSFFGLAAGQVATAISNARALAGQRRRAEALAELDRAKTEFFSNVSHEFRTPLTLILGPLEELLAAREPALPGAVREQLRLAHRNSLRLLKLVNTLLDFSTIEAGRMQVHFEPVDLAASTAELAAVFRSAIERAGLRLKVSCEPAPEPAWVDRDLWEKIVFNLLSNALKFTLQGEIEVALQRRDDVFELRVRDTGVGIPIESQQEVFERFHRLKHARGRTHEGTGIGLALVQELVRLHGGTIALASTPGEGTEITVRLPAGPPPATAPGAAENPAIDRAPPTPIGARPFVEEALRWIGPEPVTPAAPESAGPPAAGPTRRVLVADDNADMRAHVTRLLKGHYDVAAVADGNAALALVQQWQPDLVLADVMMPGLDGFGLLDALRADPATRQIAVILVSARAGEDSRVEGLESGADDYLTKPFSARELLARVKSHLHLADLRRHAEQKIVASEARLTQLVKILPAGIFAVDADGRMTFYNERAAEIWRARPQPGESYRELTRALKVLGPDGQPVAESERPIAVVLREGRSVDAHELAVERADGSRYYTNLSISPTFGVNGRVNGAIAVFQDVTAERQARNALRETEERYRAVFQQASVGILECDLQGRILRCNPALTRMVGYTEEQLRGTNWRRLAEPEELEADEAVAVRLLRGADPSFTGQRRYRRKDGSAGWLDVFATVILDASGRPVYGLAMLVDITARKRTEAELRETEERFRVAADNAPVLLWIADPAGNRTWFNRPWLEFVGRSLEQETGSGWSENLHPHDRSRALEAYHTAFDRRESFSVEYRLRRQDGVYRWMLVHGVPRYHGGEFAGYIGSCIDITDRRQAEEAMHASRNAERARREELEAITQLAPAGIWMAHDPECRQITGNAAAYAMMRVQPGENLSRQAGGVGDVRRIGIYENGRVLADGDLPIRVAARTGQSVMNRELEFRFADGTSTWAYGSATPLLDEAGRVRGVISVMVDITERKAAEAALQKSEEQLRLVTDHASVFIAQIDRELRYRFVNRSYAQRYGCEPAEIVGREVREVVGAEAFAAALEQMTRVLSGERVEFETEIPTAANTHAWASVVFVPERGPDGGVAGFVAVLTDITLRKRAELELERARDEAVAASRAKDDFLAALSHELRTPLSPVLLLASDAATDARLPPSVRSDFETIRKSVELEARLIDDLLDLTRIVRNKISLDLREVDVPVVLRDALVAVRADFEAKNIGLVLDLAPEAQLVRADPVRLQQVFWNVLKNAVKFTAAGGRVTITTTTDRKRGVVGVEIADTGIGMTAREIARVFEAFAQGDHASGGGSHRFGGLGLGLAISRRVVELHGGRITAQSAGRNRGAAFRIELPAHASSGPGIAPPPPEPPELAPRNDEVAGAGRRPRGRVLLVEDHAPTRIALEGLLARRNYEVVAAGSAGEARAQAGRTQFDLLISDIGLPDGSGYELMAEFRERYELKGIALTGYGMEDDVARSRRAGFLLHLTKPVRIQHLDEALSRVTGGAEPASGE